MKGIVCVGGAGYYATGVGSRQNTGGVGVRVGEWMVYTERQVVGGASSYSLECKVSLRTLCTGS